MEFYRHIYFGEEAKKNKKKILYRIKHRKIQKDIYVITLASNEDNLMDIYAANTLLQPGYKKADIKVIGVAIGQDEAYALATAIIQDLYTKTNEFKIKEYLGFGLMSE